MSTPLSISSTNSKQLGMRKLQTIIRYDFLYRKLPARNKKFKTKPKRHKMANRRTRLIFFPSSRVKVTSLEWCTCYRGTLSEGRITESTGSIVKESPHHCLVKYNNKHTSDMKYQVLHSSLEMQRIKDIYFQF